MSQGRQSSLQNFILFAAQILKLFSGNLWCSKRPQAYVWILRVPNLHKILSKCSACISDKTLRSLYKYKAGPILFIPVLILALFWQKNLCKWTVNLIGFFGWAYGFDGYFEYLIQCIPEDVWVKELPILRASNAILFPLRRDTFLKVFFK